MLIDLKEFCEGDQLSDYDGNHQYHFLLEGILMDDLIRVKKDLDMRQELRINSAWFQQYEKAYSLCSQSWVWWF